MNKLILLSCAMFIASSPVFSQGKLVDARDQAEGWFLPIHGQAYVDGKKVDGYRVELFKENELLGDVALTKRGQFQLELDVDHTYTVRVTKDGYESKMMLIDTHLPPGLVEYPDYACSINLEPIGTHRNSAEFYTDFPTAIIRWNESMKGFYHSEHYLEHIQTKLNELAQAVD